MAILIALTGGTSVRLGSLVVRAHRPWTALVVGLAVSVVALALSGATAVGADLAAAWRAGCRRAVLVAACAAVCTALVGLVWGTWAASGADAYGYVSQALMWKAGQLSVGVPLADGAPWPSPEWTLSPLGWRPALHAGAIVPTYAPGLPLLMALAAWLAGDAAVFWVVPLTGALAVWWTWRLGVLLTDRRAAAAASVLMAVAPAFLFQLVQPMSDVPVTAWWTGALLLALTRRPALAGACASAAILTRPNLAPLAGWLGIVLLLPRLPDAAVQLRDAPGVRGPRWLDVVWFAAGVVPGVAAWMAMNHAWYGHALTSGYGSFSELFNAANIVPNAVRYGRWLIEAQTPFVLLAVTSPAAIWWASRTAARGRADDSGRSPGRTAAGPAPPSRLLATLASLGFVALVLCAYLPYAAFEEWTYLRFLLPSMPVLLVLSCDVSCRLLARVPSALALALLVFGTTALAGYQLSQARAGQAFELQRLEQRYVEVGRQADRLLPASAVLLAVQHSGSLRLYAGRPTLRWDLLDAPAFDRALAHLRARGLTPVIVLEAWEEPQFREHLSASTIVGRLDWPPAVELSLPVKVRFYNPSDQPVFAAGGQVTTTRIRSDRKN